MPAPEIQTLGVYRIEITDELFQDTLEIMVGTLEPGEEYEPEDLERIRDLLANLVLIEALVLHQDGRFDAGDFNQKGSDLVAYDEVYLDPAGETVEVETPFEPPEGDRLRIAFFLHGFAEGVPLETSYGDVELPAVTDIPDRLRKIVAYDPYS
jgi:hypothetical protein